MTTQPAGRGADEGLREALAEALRSAGVHRPQSLHPVHLADALLPVVEEHVRRAREEALAPVWAVLERHMTVPTRDFDAKTAHPEYAHERCAVPNCSLRPWGLGTVQPGEARYCPAHEAVAEVADDLRAALGDDGTSR